MTRSHQTQPAARRGVAMLITLVFLALFASLAVAIAASADINMAVARNRANSRQAGALAETGLQFAQRHLGGLKVPGTHDAADLHHAIAAHLVSMWPGTGGLSDTQGGISWDAEGVYLPPLLLVRPDGRTGTVDLRISASGGALDDTSVTVRSIGHFDNARRTVYYNMTVLRGKTVLADYGIASKSKISMTGNAQITGVNNDAEGSILAATYSTDQAVNLQGNIDISGDVGVVNPEAYIQKRGDITVGGDEYIGAPEPDWPEVDVSVFEEFAINIQATGTSGDAVLSNIRIPPNTNPTFSGNTVIFGVVYIESPNQVTFTGNTVIVGTIVCEPPAVDNLSANELRFTGNLSTAGVENLPPGDAYKDLRDLTGSLLLAPGYSATFTGNFNTISGCIVASQFKFSGNAGGTVKGGVANLRDSSFEMSGNAHLAIDKEGAVENPAGLTSSFQLVCVSGSYSE